MTTDELRALSILAGISEGGFARLSGCAELEAGPGQVLALPNDPGSGAFLILAGDVVVEARGRSFALGKGDVVGELALLTGAHRVARVRARTPVRALAIPRDEFVGLVESEPAFALALLRELARRLVSMHETS